MTLLRAIQQFDSQAFGRWVIRWRWPVLAISLLVTLAVASGGRFITFEDSYRYFFREDNPQLQAFEQVQNIYTKNDNILFVLAPDDGTVFSSEALSAVEELTDAAWRIPHAIRVDSVTNFQYTRAEGDDLIVADLVEGAGGFNPADVERVREAALAEPLLRDRLVTGRGNVTGVNVTLELPGEEPMEQTPSVLGARKLIEEFESRYPGLEIYLTGMALLNQSFQEAAVADLTTLMPLMFGILALIMVLLLRSVSGTLGTLFTITLSTAAAMGFAGWWGLPITAPSSVAPTMILMLAIADSIHILVTMLQQMKRGATKNEAIVESIRLNLQPVFLTSLTTSIGFLSMNASDVRPFNDLGNITAVGIFAAFLYSVFFLPALMSVLPVRQGRKTRVVNPMNDGGMGAVAGFVTRNRRSLLGTGATVLLLLALLVPSNELNDQFVEYFDESIPFRGDTDFVMENLTGIYQIEYSVGAGESGGISNPEYQRTLDQFARWFRTQEDVVHVSTLSDTLRRLNQNMHGDDPEWYRLPDSRELTAQYLLLYEMSLPYGLDLNNQINVDKSATRMVVTADNVSTTRLREIVESGEQWLESNAPESMFSRGVGPGVMFAYISGRNVQSMLLGTVIAFGLISLCLVVAFRSVKFGLLSLIPNLAPAIMGFGVWGLLVGRINLGLSIVAAVNMGIIVDDTVHFLSKYLRARREEGLDPEAAVRYPLSSVGAAMTVTSLVLVGGFFVLALSPFDMNAGMGKLTAITILFALAADLLVLPALLLRFESRKTVSVKNSMVEVQGALDTVD